MFFKHTHPKRPEILARTATDACPAPVYGEDRGPSPVHVPRGMLARVTSQLRAPRRLAGIGWQFLEIRVLHIPIFPDAEWNAMITFSFSYRSCKQSVNC